MNWFHNLPFQPMTRSHPIITVAVLIALGGCNSARVVRSNFERTVENRGRPEPRPWPAHPYAPASAPPAANYSNALRTAGPAPAVEEEPEDEIIQTAAVDPQTPRSSHSHAPAGSALISGRIVDSSGRPQPLVSVIAAPTRKPGGAKVQTTTDRFGHFTLRGLEPGQRYLILATATRSPVALIGRVGVVAPQQGVTIGISRPHTSDRQADPQVGRPNDDESDHSDDEQEEEPRTTRSQHSNPFSQLAAPAPPTSSARRPAQKQTRHQAAADNRIDSPWDMPAPPTRRITPAPYRPTEDVANDRLDSRQPSSHGWREVGSAAPTPAATRFPPRNNPRTQTESHTTNESDSPDFPLLEPKLNLNRETVENGSNRLPTTSNEPLEVDANAQPDRPRTKPAHARVEQPPSVHQETPSTPQFHDQPMCQMDGKRLVDFQLNDVLGRPVSFTSIGSRFVLIDFWTTWCPPCLRAIPQLTALHQRYGAKGLQVVGIACEQGKLADRRSQVAKVRDRLHIPYPLLIDEGDDNLLVRDKFGVISYPTLVLVDQTGRIVWRREAPDQADMVQLENLLKTQLHSTAKSL